MRCEGLCPALPGVPHPCTKEIAATPDTTLPGQELSDVAATSPKYFPS